MPLPQKHEFKKDESHAVQPGIFLKRPHSSFGDKVSEYVVPMVTYAL
jgi:hypothetical protein